MMHRRALLSAFAAAPVAACATLPGSSRPLRLATFNIWHDREDWPKRLPLIVETLRAADADVIALQEVLEDAATGLPNQADTLAAALGGYEVRFTSTDAEGAPRRYGNAILSRLPILETRTRKLEPLDDYRTALRVRVDFDGRPIDVVNTHFHHTSEGASIRARQAADLLAWIGEGDAPLIVMGDFNAPLEDAGLAGLAASPRFVTALPAGAVPTTLNTNEGHQPRVIDHIFVQRDGFDVVSARVSGTADVDGVWPSDHYAVEAVVRLKS
ncbi:MAG TPA: endonuclease/exonuclease/phosphatase family protein [Brevundimonas sp.]|jgi:endonuclease/exonuclease/phosphatase family metal-dependent hydrolase|uniref:endonuclease/exonuclease/phosphatase family protein n=1 Tax=Brevundimonas sp. TaxID=1871086 RepID=UPI002DEF1522|nr:endonuclease/exonuclease/phosphatase family protein [Brevundimonas sp.]